MLTRRQLTELLLAVPFAARAATPDAPHLCSVSGVSASPGGSLAITPSSGSLPTARVGSVYSASICVSGGTPPYTVSKTADTTTCTWPTVSVSGSSVSIGAWPLAVESQTITVQVNDSASGTATGTFTIPTVSRTGYVPNISAITPYASGRANTAAYQALNVPAMAAGASYIDPVTGVKVCKLAASPTPSTQSQGFFNEYSTLGLQISQAWGPSLNKYTIIFEDNVGGVYLVDYTLGGTCSNYRTMATSEGNYSFSRVPGEAQILYYTTGAQLVRYNTGTMTAAPLGGYPYTWATVGGAWLQFNRKHTWATALTAQQGSGNNNVTALKIGNTPDSPVSDGTVILGNNATGAPGLSFNELASGYANTAVIVVGLAQTNYVWHLDTNTMVAVSGLSGETALTHQGTLPGFWAWWECNHGGGVWPVHRITDAGVYLTPNQLSTYYGSWHNSGHWTQSAAAAQQYYVASFWNTGNPSGNDTTLDWNICVIDVNSTGTSGIHTICGAYSFGDNSTPGYRGQPHATISDDGLIMVFSSCMLQGSQGNTTQNFAPFLVEVPKQ